MILRPLGGDTVTETGTLEIDSGILGAVLISADGTNAVTVILRRDNSDGDVVYKMVTKSPMFTAHPIVIESHVLYYSVTGTGGEALLYEWVT